MSFTFKLPSFKFDFAKPSYIPPKKLTMRQAEDKYGPIVNFSQWPCEKDYMCLVEIPESLKPYMINTATGEPTNRIYVNEDIAPALVYAMDLIISRGLQSKVKSFDGCLNVRKVRGGSTLSAHAYGLAIDINAAGNGLGEIPTISPELVDCFTDAGFTWGGTFKRKDGMHFSYVIE